MKYYHRDVRARVCVWLPSRPNHRDPNNNSIVVIANITVGGDDNFIVNLVVSDGIASCGKSFAKYLRYGRGNNTTII